MASPRDTTIPAWTPNGVRRRYSRDAITRLLAEDRVTVKRNRHGTIIAAFFRPPSGASPHLATYRMGQRYSRQCRVGESARSWEHRSTPSRDAYLAVVRQTLTTV